jgi:hypothetical protein
MRAGDHRLTRIFAHDDEQPGPILFSKLPERSHDPRMNPLLVGLSEAHDQNAIVLLVPVL